MVKRQSSAGEVNKSHTGSSRRKSDQPRKSHVFKEIKYYRKTTHLLLRKLPFSRLVREISLRFNPELGRWQSLALQALQEAVEDWIVQYFEDAKLLAAHARRVTVMPKDFLLLNELKG